MANLLLKDISPKKLMLIAQKGSREANASVNLSLSEQELVVTV